MENKTNTKINQNGKGAVLYYKHHDPSYIKMSGARRKKYNRFRDQGLSHEEALEKSKATPNAGNTQAQDAKRERPLHPDCTHSNEKIEKMSFFLPNRKLRSKFLFLCRLGRDPDEVMKKMLSDPEVKNIMDDLELLGCAPRIPTKFKTKDNQHESIPSQATRPKTGRGGLANQGISRGPPREDGPPGRDVDQSFTQQCQRFIKNINNFDGTGLEMIPLEVAGTSSDKDWDQHPPRNDVEERFHDHQGPQMFDSQHEFEGRRNANHRGSEVGGPLTDEYDRLLTNVTEFGGFGLDGSFRDGPPESSGMHPPSEPGPSGKKKRGRKKSKRGTESFGDQHTEPKQGRFEDERGPHWSGGMERGPGPMREDCGNAHRRGPLPPRRLPPSEEPPWSADMNLRPEVDREEHGYTYPTGSRPSRFADSEENWTCRPDPHIPGRIQRRPGENCEPQENLLPLRNEFHGSRPFNNGPQSNMMPFNCGPRGMPPLGDGPEGNMLPFNDGLRGNVPPFNTGLQGNGAPFMDGPHGNMPPFNDGLRGNMPSFNTGTQGPMAPFSDGPQGNMAPFINGPHGNVPLFNEVPHGNMPLFGDAAHGPAVQFNNIPRSNMPPYNVGPHGNIPPFNNGPQGSMPVFSGGPHDHVPMFSYDFHGNMPSSATHNVGPSHRDIPPAGAPVPPKRYRDEASQGGDPKAPLYIVPARYPSERFSEEQMDAIENTILEAILVIDDERLKPTFQESFRSNGRYGVICNDQHSKDWLFNYLTTCRPWPYASFKIISAPPKIKAEAVLPLCKIDDNNKILQFIAKQNIKLNVRQWEVIQRLDSVSNTALSLGIDEESARVLRESSTINFKMGRAEIVVQGGSKGDHESSGLGRVEGHGMPGRSRPDRGNTGGRLEMHESRVGMTGRGPRERSGSFESPVYDWPGQDPFRASRESGQLPAPPPPPAWKDDVISLRKSPEYEPSKSDRFFRTPSPEPRAVSDSHTGERSTRGDPHAPRRASPGSSVDRTARLNRFPTSGGHIERDMSRSVPVYSRQKGSMESNAGRGRPLERSQTVDRSSSGASSRMPTIDESRRRGRTPESNSQPRLNQPSRSNYCPNFPSRR